MTPRETVLTSIKGAFIEHRYYRTALDTLLAATTWPAPEEILLVVGPTGAGKSILLERLTRLLGEGQSNPFHALLVSAQHPMHRMFDWKDFFQRLQIAAKNPLLGLRRLASESPSGVTIFEGAARNTSASSERFNAEVALRNRNVAFLLIDEMQDMLERCEGADLYRQLSNIKSFARSLAPHLQIIMAGTYDSLRLWNMNGQLNRRVNAIHYAAYGALPDIPREQIGLLSIEEEISEFVAILGHFESVMAPVCRAGLLLDSRKRLHEITAGNIGEVTKILYKAVRALPEKGKSISFRDIERAALTPTQLSNYKREEQLGMSVLLGRELTLEQIQLLRQSSPKTPCRNRRPGERNPTRDVAG